MVTLAVVATGLVALGALMIPAARQQESTSLRLQVLNRAASLMEEMAAEPADKLILRHDGRVHAVDGVEGASGDGTALVVAVSEVRPHLLGVTVTGSWRFGTEVHDLQLRTEIYDP